MINRKGQITVFIIIALIILIAVGAFFYVINAKSKAEPDVTKTITTE